MSFARFENMNVCKTEMTQLGHTPKDADHICIDIKDRAEKGILYKATPQGLTVLSKAGDPDLVIGGYASWELVDPERDIITIQAQSKGLQRFFHQAPEYQSITVNHKEFKLAQPVLKYVDSEGHEYFSHVNEKGTYLISKLRNDKLKTTQVFREKARNGDFTHYSISGSPLETQIVKAEDGLDVRRVDDIEYWAITLCEKGVVQAVNPKATVALISKSQNACNISECHSECCRHIALKVANSGSDFEKYAANHGITVKSAEKGMSWVRLPLVCRELDESGFCKSYETRPDLCRVYPYAIGTGPFIEKAACSLATVTKSEPILPLEVLQKTVEKRGNQWCVVHCHGEEAGEAIKCFDTKEEADAMHAAMQANKAIPESTDFILEVEQILQKHGFNRVK